MYAIRDDIQQRHKDIISNSIYDISLELLLKLRAVALTIDQPIYICITLRSLMRKLSKSLQMLLSGPIVIAAACSYNNRATDINLRILDGFNAIYPSRLTQMLVIGSIVVATARSVNNRSAYIYLRELNQFYAKHSISL